MKTKTSVAGTWVVTLLTWGCTAGDAPDPGDRPYSVRDSAGVRIVENERPAWDTPWIVADSPLVRIGDASGAPEHELFRVAAAVRLSDGRLVIANGGTGEVRWYGPTGEFVRSSGGPGEGPGEFLSLSRMFLLPGDSIAVADVRQRRFSVFDRDGALIRTVRVDGPPGGPLPIGRFADRTLLMTSGQVFALGAQGPARVERMPLGVFRFREEDGESPEPMLTLPGLEVDIGPSGGIAPDGSMPIGRGPRPFGRNTMVVADATGWVIGDNDRPRLEFRDPNGNLTVVARWPAEPRAVTPRDVEAYRAPTLDRLTDPVARNRMQEAWAQRPDPPDRMPAFGSLLLDYEGYVWVKEYAPSFEEDPNRYAVFDRGGAWLGTVALPEGVSVLAIGGDWMVGVRRDDLGIETVVIHEIARRLSGGRQSRSDSEQSPPDASHLGPPTWSVRFGDDLAVHRIEGAGL